MRSVVRMIALAGFAAAIMVAGSACISTGGHHAEVPPELLHKPYLFEVVRHLYRWHLGESDVLRIPGQSTFDFWVRDLLAKLDEGDRSRYAEITVPTFNLVVTVKKPDYRIAELGVTVTGTVYKIVNVQREALPRRVPRGYTVVSVDCRDMEEYLFRTRAQVEFPGPALLEKMQVATQREIQNQGRSFSPEVLQREQIAYLAPMSPVANECWIYWENGKTLIRFASDIDLAAPAVWAPGEITARLYDLDRQVVVSLDEAAGSNAFLTRDEAGRNLFNCVVRGMRLSTRPPESAREAKP